MSSEEIETENKNISGQEETSMNEVSATEFSKDDEKNISEILKEVDQLKDPIEEEEEENEKKGGNFSPVSQDSASKQQNADEKESNQSENEEAKKEVVSDANEQNGDNVNHLEDEKTEASIAGFEQKLYEPSEIKENEEKRITFAPEFSFNEELMQKRKQSFLQQQQQEQQEKQKQKAEKPPFTTSYSSYRRPTTKKKVVVSKPGTDLLLEKELIESGQKLPEPEQEEKKEKKHAIRYDIELNKKGIESFSNPEIKYYPERCSTVDLSFNRIVNFEGLPSLPRMTSLIVDQNPIRSLKGVVPQKRLKFLSIKRCPLSKNPYFKLMCIVAFDTIKAVKGPDGHMKYTGSLQIVNDSKITDKLREQAYKIAGEMRQSIVEGKVITNLSPLRIIDNEVDSDRDEDRKVEPNIEMVQAAAQSRFNMDSAAKKAKEDFEQSSIIREPVRPSVAYICNELLLQQDFNMFGQDVISDVIGRLTKLRQEFDQSRIEEEEEEADEEEEGHGEDEEVTDNAEEEIEEQVDNHEEDSHENDNDQEEKNSDDEKAEEEKDEKHEDNAEEKEEENKEEQQEEENDSETASDNEEDNNTENQDKNEENTETNETENAYHEEDEEEEKKEEQQENGDKEENPEPANEQLQTTENDETKDEKQNGGEDDHENNEENANENEQSQTKDDNENNDINNEEEEEEKELNQDDNELKPEEEDKQENDDKNVNNNNQEEEEEEEDISIPVINDI